VWGDPNGDHAKRVFEIELTCFWQGSALQIPGGATRQITITDGVRYSDLPVGADCTLVETDNGGAVLTTMTPENGADASTARVTVEAGAAASIVVDNTYEIGLPLTGGQIALWAVPFGAILLLAGGGFVVAGMVRRRQNA